jgi:hypothetical protein
MSKKKKIILAVFLGTLTLMSFHPVGRIVVKWILPLGVGIMDLIGTGFAIVFLLVLLLPRKGLRIKLQRNKKTASADQPPVSPVKNRVAQEFIFELAKRDKESRFISRFMNIVDVGAKRNKSSLVEDFINYYGKLTIKFLDSRNDLLAHNVSFEINQTAESIEQALREISRICDKFIAKLIDGDLADIRADIKVLGIIGSSENLL